MLLAALALTAPLIAQDPSAPSLELVASGAGARSFGGTYPHLASFNGSNECGIGAVVPWADRLWWVTYAPHAPDGSDDRLYAMDPGRDLFVSPASIGGTPANRMIHRESRQLFLGPYAIDAGGGVRAIPYARMRGRPTGTARHLTDPAARVYVATMEEGLYEVDVETLEVTTLFSDTHDGIAETESGLPGYHGKGLYSGQGVVVYANNGEAGAVAQTRPDVPSGALAEWSGEGAWRLVRRNQFTEVTGPGGIRGNDDPLRDPIWSVGWDHRSLLLMLRSAEDEGAWRRFRLPKASHAYDGAHGWNTEWPRIRDVGEDDLLMTMHGTLWRFPRAFDAGATGGVAPRSTYLRVVGDVCRYGDEIVLGCDDAARSEFLNRRRAKGALAGPAQSQSNLWFVAPETLDRLGPPIGRGGVLVDEDVAADAWSDRFLFEGFDLRGVHLVHDADEPVTFRFEVEAGDGSTARLDDVAVGAGGYAFHAFEDDDRGAWVRVAVSRDARVTVWFEMRDRDARTAATSGVFDALSAPGAPAVGGLVRAGDRARGLQVLATRVGEDGDEVAGYYELGPDLSLVRVEDAGPEAGEEWMRENVAIPTGVVELDGESLLYVDDDGARWRLPVGNPAYRDHPEWIDRQRTAREVVTERDLFHCGGTFFELPARNAGGFAKVRPVATHEAFVHDFASWRGLLVLTGLRPDAPEGDARVVRSEDGACAVWLGVVDELWQLGKPRGAGGPWSGTAVRAGEPSDPFLMAGYDEKSVALEHDGDRSVRMTLEVDVTGTGTWYAYGTFDVPRGESIRHEFPDAFAAYWVRAVADADCRATVRFTYR